MFDAAHGGADDDDCDDDDEQNKIRTTRRTSLDSQKHGPAYTSGKTENLNTRWLQYWKQQHYNWHHCRPGCLRDLSWLWLYGLLPSHEHPTLSSFEILRNEENLLIYFLPYSTISFKGHSGNTLRSRGRPADREKLALLFLVEGNES